MSHRYFIRYLRTSFDGVERTINTEVGMKTPITSIEDINKIRKIINEDIGNRWTVDIISWQKFEDPT